MKLELTTLEAINLNMAISNAQTKIKGAKLALGMRLAYNAKKLAEVTESFDENRTKLLDECGKKDEDGKLIPAENGEVMLSDANRFNAGVKELLSEKFEVELKPLDDKLFPEAIDADVVAGLFPIIVEEAA